MLQRAKHAPEQSWRKISAFRPSKRTILLIASVATITAITQGLVIMWLGQSDIFNSQSFFGTSSEGTIQVVGVEASGGDLKTINGSSKMDWGTFYLGESKAVSFTVKSVSNMPIRVAYKITDLRPKGLERYMTLNWNYTGTTMPPKEQIPVKFTLSLSASTETLNYLVTNKITTFTLDIRIYAYESRG